MTITSIKTSVTRYNDRATLAIAKTEQGSKISAYGNPDRPSCCHIGAEWRGTDRTQAAAARRRELLAWATAIAFPAK